MCGLGVWGIDFVDWSVCDFVSTLEREPPTMKMVGFTIHDTNLAEERGLPRTSDRATFCTLSLRKVRPFVTFDLLIGGRRTTPSIVVVFLCKETFQCLFVSPRDLDGTLGSQFVRCTIDSVAQKDSSHSRRLPVKKAKFGILCTSLLCVCPKTHPRCFSCSRSTQRSSQCAIEGLRFLGRRRH